MTGEADGINQGVDSRAKATQIHMSTSPHFTNSSAYCVTKISSITTEGAWVDSRLSILSTPCPVDSTSLLVNCVDLEAAGKCW